MLQNNYFQEEIMQWPKNSLSISRNSLQICYYHVSVVWRWID